MTSRYNHAQNGSLNFVVQKNVIFVVKTLIQIFTKNITITYTFVATNRAKKIAYGVGRDSLPLKKVSSWRSLMGRLDYWTGFVLVF